MRQRGSQRLAGALFAVLAGLCGLTTVQSAAPIWPGDVAVDTLPFNQGLAILDNPGIGLVPDGAGGVILVWEDHQLHNDPDIYARVAAQRLSADGEPLWGAAGVAVAPASRYQWQPEVVSDGAGGVIVFYLQSDLGGCGPVNFYYCQLRAQRLDGAGEPVWDEPIGFGGGGANEGVIGLAAASDGAGGAIVMWSDNRFFQHGDAGGVFVQRVGADGAVLWDPRGVNLARADALQRGMEAVPDGAGGAVLVWMESHPFTTDIRVQRVDSDGAPLWAENVNPGLDHYAFRVPSVVTDGAGGVLLGFSVALSQFELQAVVLRIDADGDMRWPSPTLVAPSNTFQGNVRLLADGAGGAIATWEDGTLRCLVGERRDCDVHAQRLSAEGARLWSDAGVVIADRPTVERGAIPVSDGAGGALVFWNDCRAHPDSEDCFYGMDLYAQRVDADGQRRWRPGGIAVSTAAGNQGVSKDITEEEMTLVVMPDGAGGAFAAWPDGRSAGGCYIYEPGGCDLYAQHVVPGPNEQFAACEDGGDDDGDGRYDFPDDPGCDSASDDSERSEALACDDGADGDGDGRVDYPVDPGCDAPDDGSEWSAGLACDNGTDDDGDGAIDGEDSGCASALDATEFLDTACDDGRDNDGDGFVDYPMDPACESPDGANERASCAPEDWLCHFTATLRGSHRVRVKHVGRREGEGALALAFEAGRFAARDGFGFTYGGSYALSGRDRATLRFDPGEESRLLLPWLRHLPGAPPAIVLQGASEAAFEVRAKARGPEGRLSLRWRTATRSERVDFRATLAGEMFHF